MSLYGFYRSAWGREVSFSHLFFARCPKEAWKKFAESHFREEYDLEDYLADNSNEEEKVESISEQIALLKESDWHCETLTFRESLIDAHLADKVPGIGVFKLSREDYFDFYCLATDVDEAFEKFIRQGIDKYVSKEQMESVIARYPEIENEKGEDVFLRLGFDVSEVGRFPHEE